MTKGTYTLRGTFCKKHLAEARPRQRWSKATTARRAWFSLIKIKKPRKSRGVTY